MNNRIKTTIIILTVFILSVLSSILFLSFKYKDSCKVDLNIDKNNISSVLTVSDDINSDIKEASLVENESITIKISFNKNSVAKNIIWLSDNKDIAEVDQDGKVTAKKPGITKITAKTFDNKIAEVKIYVKESITVIYHRNLNDNDSIELRQTLVKGNKNTYGIINNKKYDFELWDTSHKLLGWSIKKDTRVPEYEIYDDVSDDWINDVYNKKIDTQKDKKVIDLYAIWAEDIDLVLFFGQSNMVGYTGMYKYEQETKDTRDLTKFIDEDILKEYKTFSYVSVQIPENTAYDFRIDEKNKSVLEMITSKTKTLGEKSIYIDNKFRHSKKGDEYYSLLPSYGTNMIPQFAKTYYDETGNKMVSVMASNGGEPIANFLPSTDQEYKDNQHIYDAAKEKYLRAVEYLENNGYRVVNRFYVMYQGCSDATEELSKDNKYYDTYMKVHNYLKKDLGLSFGVLVETSWQLNQKKDVDEYVKKIHEEQEKLINNNKDIILGSDLGYVAYDKEYKEIFALEEVPKDDKTINNSIHLTAASLSQVGKDSAKNAAKYLKNK